MVYTCSICNEEFSSKSKLDNHRRAVHQESVQIKLDSGPIVIKRNETGQFQCPQCGLMSKWAHSIRRHVISCQPVINQFERIATIDPANPNQNGILTLLLILKMNYKNLCLINWKKLGFFTTMYTK